MVAVDPIKVLNSRSEIQREWVKRVFSFNSVWDNGKVFLWRPVVPTVAARFLQRKRLHPLGWIFTTSPAPPVRFCTESDGLCTENDEFCTKNDGFCRTLRTSA